MLNLDMIKEHSWMMLIKQSQMRLFNFSILLTLLILNKKRILLILMIYSILTTQERNIYKNKRQIRIEDSNQRENCIISLRKNEKII